MKNKLITTPEQSEQYRIDRTVENAKRSFNRNPLQDLNNSKLGKTLDKIDLAADVVSLTPTPAAPVAAAVGTVTGIPQAMAAAQEYGLQLARGERILPSKNQLIAASKIIPTSNLFTSAGKSVGKMLGKSDKYMRRAHTYFPSKLVQNGITLSKRSKIGLALADPKRIPILLGYMIPDIINLGSDVYELSNGNDEPIKRNTFQKDKYKL